MVDTYTLHCHPDTPARNVRSVTVEAIPTIDDILLTYRIDGAEFVAFPEMDSPHRTDGLWKTTCFELFLKPVGAPNYVEFNFSPSNRWAAYTFDSYRAGMRDLDLDVEPHIAMEDTLTSAWDVDCDLGNVPSAPLVMGISAIIEEADGTKSCWALAHAPGPPDFHNPDCFIATLSAPGRP
jgi:hypothetical protein